jgi:gamma-glutamyltranspeptidase
MPPPSSGGVHVVQILNTLEGFPLGFLGHNGSETIHLMAEAMKLAYADRSEYPGDPDFVDVPVAALASEGYAEHLRSLISRGRARPAAEIGRGDLGALRELGYHAFLNRRRRRQRGWPTSIRSTSATAPVWSPNARQRSEGNTSHMRARLCFVIFWAVIVG